MWYKQTQLTWVLMKTSEILLPQLYFSVLFPVTS